MIAVFRCFDDPMRCFDYVPGCVISQSVLLSHGLTKDNYASRVVNKNGYTKQKVILIFEFIRFITRTENNVSGFIISPHARPI